MSSRCVVYIDGANLHKGVSDSGWSLDFGKFRLWLKDKFNVGTAKFFIGYVGRHSHIYENLVNAGYELHFKEVASTTIGVIKGNCDGELIAEAICDYFEGEVERAVLVSSDGDFSVLIKFYIERSIPVSIISPWKSCSYLLIRSGVPMIYLITQKGKLAYNKRALGEDGTSQRSLS